jgi:hypothetical protein
MADEDNDGDFQLRLSEMSFWDEAVVKNLTEGSTAEVTGVADEYIRERRKRLVKLEPILTRMEQTALATLPLSMGGRMEPADMPPMAPMPTMGSAEGRGHLASIDGAGSYQFLYCENTEGGMDSFIGSAEEVVDSLTTHRYPVEGENDRFRAWAKTALIGEILEFSKGIITRVMPGQKTSQ